MEKNGGTLRSRHGVKEQTNDTTTHRQTTLVRALLPQLRSRMQSAAIEEQVHNS